MNKYNIHALVIRCSESLISIVAKFAYSQLLECGIFPLFPAVSTVKNDPSFNLVKNSSYVWLPQGNDGLAQLVPRKNTLTIFF